MTTENDEQCRSHMSATATIAAKPADQGEFARWHYGHGDQNPRLLEYEMINNWRIHNVAQMQNNNVYFLTLVTFIVGGLTFIFLNNDFRPQIQNHEIRAGMLAIIGIFAVTGTLFTWRSLAHTIDDAVVDCYRLLGDIEKDFGMRFTLEYGNRLCARIETEKGGEAKFDCSEECKLIGAITPPAEEPCKRIGNEAKLRDIPPDTLFNLLVCGIDNLRNHVPKREKLFSSSKYGRAHNFWNKLALMVWLLSTLWIILIACPDGIFPVVWGWLSPIIIALIPATILLRNGIGVLA